MVRYASLLGLLWLSFANSAFSETVGDRALARLRSLAGEWQGSYEWSGGRTGSGKIRAAYHVTGNDSAVVENLTMGGEAAPSMTSVYHLDGADLRMTHFCAARNQPRLRATEIDEAGGVVRFSFLDATNLVAQPSHVEAVEIRFLSKDRLVLRFTFGGAKTKSVEHIELERARSPS